MNRKFNLNLTYKLNNDEFKLEGTSTWFKLFDQVQFIDQNTGLRA